MFHRLFLLFAGLFFSIGPAGAQQYLRYPFERLIRTGDDPSWADPGLNDEDWDPSGSTKDIGNLWVRFRVNCDSITDTYIVPGMQVISLGSYEVFWDSILIGGSGIVGKNRATETPGSFLSHLPVPDSLMGHGEHIVAFRVSNYHIPNWGMDSWNLFYLEEYLFSQQSDLKLTARIFILAGVYLMAGLYYLFLYLFRKREWVGLIFSASCFLFFGLIVMEYLKFLYAYPYPFHFTRLLIIFGLTFLLAFLVPLFFLLYFNVPRKGLWSLLVLGGLILISLVFLPGTDTTGQYLTRAMWMGSLCIALYAAYRHKPESRLILLALLASGAVTGLYHMQFRSMLFSYDITLFVSFSLLVVSMMYVLAMRAREQKRAYESSLVLSARLQNELLKKHIQPHFIMNTLTSLMEWVEESPKDSVRFIEELSGEFEILSHIADKKLIPIEQEILLCRRHIGIMRFRKEVDYTLDLENIPPGEMIPPAVFHTLVENGITHSYPDPDNRVRMVLSFERTPNYRCFQLKVFARGRTGTLKKKEGTGFKYIRSRMVENYGDQWRMETGGEPEGWVTRIIFLNGYT